VERYRLIFTQRRVLPLAVAVALVGAAVAQVISARIVCGVVAALAILAAWIQGRGKPALILDERGYAVEENGREKLRVAWGEVQKIRADSAESALYVEIGDPARNLLVPPKRGYGFRFERPEELFRNILLHVPPEKIEFVSKL
jgi:hypothetical protein